MRMKKLCPAVFILLINIFFINILEGQINTIKYTTTSAEIANPERGWYDHTQTVYGSYSPLNAQNLISNRENNNITLILRLFYLTGLTNQDNVPNEYLADMQADFNTIRSAGIKCIVRFAYSSSQSASIWDAPPEIVNSHIASLKEVLYNNSDVIVGVQAGFIGVWGEWYYTKNFAGSGYMPSSTDQENRRILVENLLDIFPDHVAVQGRTPAIMRNINETNDPISAAEAFTGSFKSRVGHHNDCFLANASDYGTYVNLEEDLAYLRESTKYTITGGETCDASNDYSNCENSVPRMQELHWTYLNRGYNRSVYDKWIDEGCWDDVNLLLGYRINLDSAMIAESVEPGSALKLTLALTNQGFAAPTHYKPIQLVLTHTVSGAKTVINYSGTNGDIRHWLPGDIKLDGEVIIPLDLADGNYSLGIQLSDQDPGLADNPAYSIQFANVGTWDEINGVNNLNYIVTVGIGGEGSLPNKPSELIALALSESEINLSWIDNSDDETGFEIMRSKNDENSWEYLTSLSSNTTEYTDESLSRGTNYNYIIRALNTYGASSWSGVATATTTGVSAYNPSLNQAVTLYPNPLSEGTLSFNFSDESEKRIIIRNISGEKVFDAITNQSHIQISREFFNAGMYVVTIYEGNELVIRKLLVL